MSSTRLLVVHARSPLHAGTGQSTAAVDLPIARDRATGLPLLPGSSIKGALRARGRAERKKEDYIRVFGPETENASDHAGSVTFSDARLLLLPVRSVSGTFAWVTSPWLIALFGREAKLAAFALPQTPAVPEPKYCQTSKDSLLTTTLGKRKSVVLEEFDLDVEPGLATDLAAALAKILFPDDPAWQTLFQRRFCLVHDDVMSFLGQHGTEIVTRVSIDPETGTARDGQLWTEENLPAESVLVGVVEEVPVGRGEWRPGSSLEVVRDLVARPIQLGGKATVGRGRCQLHLRGGQR